MVRFLSCTLLLSSLVGCATFTPTAKIQHTAAPDFLQKGHFSLRYQQHIMMGRLTWQHCDHDDHLTIQIPLDTSHYHLHLTPQHITLERDHHVTHTITPQWLAQQNRWPAHWLEALPYWAQGKRLHHAAPERTYFEEMGYRIDYHTDGEHQRYTIQGPQLSFLFVGEAQYVTCPAMTH